MRFQTHKILKFFSRICKALRRFDMFRNSEFTSLHPYPQRIRLFKKSVCKLNGRTNYLLCFTQDWCYRVTMQFVLSFQKPRKKN